MFYALHRIYSFAYFVIPAFRESFRKHTLHNNNKDSGKAGMTKKEKRPAEVSAGLVSSYYT
jgi:hypothetical protein